jgi:hypothetical protein
MARTQIKADKRRDFNPKVYSDREFSSGGVTALQVLRGNAMARPGIGFGRKAYSQSD